MSIKESFPILKQLNNKYTLIKWRQRRVSYGNENADKTFYVIRRAQCQCGLFSYVTTCLGGINYAINKGFIPVIDMQNEVNTYLQPNLVGKENSWEYFFEQPVGYTLQDIGNSQNIILSDGIAEHIDKMPDYLVGWNENVYEYWHDISKKYLKINSKLIENYSSSLSLNFERTIGVLARGTDYITLKPSKHPIQPTAMELIKIIDEMLEGSKYSYIYLATEDEDIYLEMKDRYGDKLIAPKTVRYSSSEIGNINRTEALMKDPYLAGVDYLKSIWILSKCNALVAGNVSGTIGALLLNDKYEYKYIFNKGLYE